ncbi:hypothetical protein SteCoe_26389 [Stentor coeruleus]|uniref:Uncharacterized protein n=1 Tax=Stentor coeruleus TaxID=5963 RepID=A0A1R2BDD3_9CILI|nr:hypothetical protein SteCoe_26389 [Stentor coeruleus]
MTTELPEVSSCKHKFSKMIDSIIEDCQNLEPHPLKISHELEQGYSRINVIYDQLQNKNFNPRFIDRFIHEGHTHLDAYLEKRENDLKVPEDFKEILKSSPTHKKTLLNNPSNFTFDSVKGEKVSKILFKNKRGFGQNWKDPVSSVISPDNVLKNSMQSSPVNDRSHVFGSLSPVGIFKTTEGISPNALKEKDKLLGSKGNFPSHKRFRPDFIVVNRNFSMLNEEKSPETTSPVRPLRIINPHSQAKYSSLVSSPTNHNFNMNHALVTQLLIRKSPENPHNYRSKSKVIENPESPKKSLISGDWQSDQSTSIGNKSNTISEYINKLLEKNLGIRSKKLELKRKTKRVKEKFVVVHNATEGHDNEGQYLNPEYIKYNSDVTNKLKIQRIIVAKHQQQRRATLINFPPLKKSKAIDGLIEETE